MACDFVDDQYEPFILSLIHILVSSSGAVARSAGVIRPRFGEKENDASENNTCSGNGENNDGENGWNGNGENA